VGQIKFDSGSLALQDHEACKSGVFVLHFVLLRFDLYSSDWLFYT